MTFKELPVISAGPIVHSPKQNEPIIGIDLGTTNSLVAIVENGIPRIIETREGRNTLPSVVRIDKNEVVVGFAAKAVRSSNSSNTIYSVKRLLGRGLSDIASIRDQLPYDLDDSDASNIKIKVGNRSYTPIEISAMILQELKASAEENLGRPIEDAVITVPAYFNDSQRQATRAAGRLAGLNVLRIVNEPTAAALAYGIHQKRTGLIAVYDFGGGTFDISILKLRDGIFEVLSTNGNTQLGGDDLDHLIATYLETKYGLTINSPQERSSLIEKAEKLKVALSEKDEANLDSLALNKRELESVALPLLEKSRKPCLDALKDAGINKSDLTDVVLVGGPTRLGVIQDFVEKLFDRKPNASLHPDEVVAAGAAVQADILAGNNRDFLLLDVVPLSLGIETFGGTMNKLIPRNTRIPTLAKEQFTTYVEGQTKVAINVYQGERELVADNRKLAEFILSGIPPLPAGVARIEVTFLVDADGILSVSAKEIYSEIEAAIEVKPTYGLTDEEVERMLEDGLMNFESDARLKRLVDAKNDARAVLVATEKSLPALKDRLDTSELEKISALVNRMNDALKGEDYNEVKAAHKALDAGTTKMAELLMNETISKDLKNKNASDFIRK